MSFINYYPAAEKKKEFEVIQAVYWGLGITACFLLLWFTYGTEYRYSSERIADRLSKKYNKPVGEDQTIIATNGKISTDGKTASAWIRISDRNASVNPEELFKLPIVDGCSPLVKTCVNF